MEHNLVQCSNLCTGSYPKVWAGLEIWGGLIRYMSLIFHSLVEPKDSLITVSLNKIKDLLAKRVG